MRHAHLTFKTAEQKYKSLLTLKTTKADLVPDISCEAVSDRSTGRTR